MRKRKKTISVAGLAIVAIPVNINAVSVLDMHTNNTMSSICHIEYRSLLLK